MDVFVTFLVTTMAAGLAGVLAYWTAKLAVSKTRADLGRAAADQAFAGLTILYITIFASLSILQFLSLHIDGYDLGFFDQAIWNTLRGRILALSVVPDDPTVLGQHFSPILLALVPLYAIWSSPHVLLVVQTLAIAASAFPIYWFARARLGNTFGLVIALAYFLFPALEFVNLSEFHEIVFVILLYSYALYFLLSGHDRRFLVCLGLSLLVKEEIAFSLVLFGAFMFLLRKRRWLGLGMALFGPVLGVLLLEFVLPFWRGTDYGTGSYFLGHGMAGGYGRYDYLGKSVGEILGTLVSRPGVVLEHVLIPEKLGYVLSLLVPLAFVPLAGIEVTFLALPTLAFSMLSSYPVQYSIFSQYPAPTIPILFFGLVIGIERCVRWTREDTRVATKWGLAAAVMAANICSYIFQAPGPLALHFDPGRYTITQHATLGQEMIRQVPENGALVTQGPLLPFATNRKLVYQFPFILDYRQADYLFLDKHSFPGGDLGDWRTLFDTGYFETLKEQDGYVIARRRAPDKSAGLQFGDAVQLAGYGENITQTLCGGQLWRPIVEWQAVRSMGERYAMAVQLVDSRGHVWARQDGEPQKKFGRTDRWQVGQAVGDQYELQLPSTMPPGEYRLVIGVHASEDEYLEAVDAQGRALGEQPVLATVRVEKDHTSLTASQLLIEQPLFVDMGEIRFLGYVPPRQTISPGELLPVGLYWRARGQPQGDYTVAVQLREPSGQVAYEEASLPAGGAYPTTVWQVGEVLLDWHDLTLPASLAPGDYQLWVVLREAAGARLLGETMVQPVSVRGR